MITGWKKKESRWRRQLLSYARGHVLELGTGEGNNFGFYPPGVHVTATDRGKKILAKASVKAVECGVRSEFIVLPDGIQQLSGKTFDTIVCTFFLSTLNNPEKTLGEMGQWCKPGGYILILDYGLSRIKPVSWLQRKWEKINYKKTGCYLSHDLLNLFSELNIQLVETKSKFAGIIYLIWATRSVRTYDKHHR